MIKLAQYSLVELIQDSGTTCIYMGERTTDGAQVTVKLCKAEYPSARDVLRLRHEYGILKELGEQGLQGIPRAYALENHGAGLALVMERLPGRPLHQDDSYDAWGSDLTYREPVWNQESLPEPINQVLHRLLAGTAGEV